MTALLLAAIAPPAAAGEVIRAMRTWPAIDYTRVTLESNGALRYTLSVVKDPERLVLDLEDVDLAAIPPDADRFRDDPYVKGMRLGRFKPGVLRMVFDLKGEVRPQAFALKPVGEYGHRLVLDIYPIEPPDPLLALLRREEQRAPATDAPDAAAPAAGTPPAAPTATPPAITPPAITPPESVAPAPSATVKPPEKPVPGNPYQRTLTIVVDAGHGGEDPGARGRNTHEKDVTLAIARKLKALIDAEPHMRAVLTRDGDFYVPLTSRVEKARRVRGDLFVSVHADAFVQPHARGSSVFALSERGATSEAARWLARRENDADLIGGVNLDRKDRHLAQTLLDLSQTAQIADSLKLGRAVLGELAGINKLHKNYVEQAGFAVLKAPDIPSILVETAFISNPEEEKRLGDDAYQTRMARAILTGIKRYFARNPPVSRSTIAAAPGRLQVAAAAESAAPLRTYR